MIEKLKKMVDLKEKIRSAETKFREKCKDDLQLMRERNEAVRTEMRSLDGVQGTGEKDGDLRKIENLKEVYSKLSQENFKLERLIDSSPSKPELSQYQKRFIELNNQISTKHAETQNFYDMFNNLTLQKFFIEKEIKLLTSIQDNLSECSGTQSTKYAFIRSIEELVSGVKEAKKKAEEKLEDQMKITAVARKEGERLREEREEYYSLLHEIQQELKKE
ncbi:coiled-coil domain-containing protein 93 [Eurytemora carolleeae]|uniref:coiled-coil domain-containing protein 93 n=1 Tax=Eurytemora carolleeae TaxID=1294199 RepID=UPI000C77669F|nr:coiled-coil domain-containing protein 93 [Eurytemora carolleeae]|eukprot:XP_023344583.1 coiled-coil domain-containing protein 93-like [Eurytemora affinis]